MSEEKIINGYYQPNIKTSRQEDSVYVMKYASQQMMIDKLQQKNQKYKEVIDKAIEINKQIKEFVYNEMVDRCVPGSTELYELVKEELKILKGGEKDK